MRGQPFSGEEDIPHGGAQQGHPRPSHQLMHQDKQPSPPQVLSYLQGGHLCAVIQAEGPDKGDPQCTTYTGSRLSQSLQ